MSEYSEDQGFFERIGEFLADHGRTIVSIIVVVLLVGTGIYAYTRDGAEDGIEERIEDLANQDEETENTEDMNGEENQDGPVSDDTSTNDDSQAESTEDTPAPTETEIVRVDQDSNDVTAKAAYGDGVTHLAREAVSRYITENSIEGIEPGHRVYMETTLKNQYYQESLAVGQEITFTGADLAQVVEDAQNLNEHQLANWAYYAQFISAY